MRSVSRALSVLLFGVTLGLPAVAQDNTAPSGVTAVAEVAVPVPSMALPASAPEMASPMPVEAVPAPIPAERRSVIAAPVSAPPANPVVTALLERLKTANRNRGVDKGDLGAAEAFYGAADARPVWTAPAGLSPRGEAAIREIAAADDWGLRASDYELPVALPANADATVLAEAELKIALAVLEYARHARGGRMDPSDLSFNIDRRTPTIEPAKVIADASAATDVAAFLRKLHPQHLQFELLRQKYLEARRAPADVKVEPPAESPQAKGKAVKARAPKAEEKLATRILYNMEMWRWMPEDLGSTYIASNIPEYMVRVVKAGAVIHEERIITGKVDTQTPIFSDMMEHIVFHPFWGVPDSIKVKEVWPSLAGGGSMVERNGLRVQYNGRDVDPRSINWSSNDIRKFHVYQPPGPNNVLGVVKFMFPNKHQVYMHDTPTKNLFNSTQRTFSHGCMRVRNPMRLAEVILQEDKGWDAARVNGLVKGGPQNNHIYLDRKIPVHVTYFTAVVGDDGKLRTFPDVYGHEPKIQMGIDGKAHLIVKKKPSLTPPDAITSMAEAKQNTPLASWMKQVFGNF